MSSGCPATRRSASSKSSRARLRISGVMWSSGFAQKYGLYELDDGHGLQAKPSAEVYRRIIRGARAAG